MTDSQSSPPEDDPLAFTPVPTASTRHDGWTPERQWRFIRALATMGVVAAAARAVGKSSVGVYKLRDRPGAEYFARAWEIAVMMGQDRAFGIAYDRALNGYDVPRIYRGVQVGTVRRIDHRLLVAALRTRMSVAVTSLTRDQQEECDALLSGNVGQLEAIYARPERGFK